AFRPFLAVLLTIPLAGGTATRAGAQPTAKAPTSSDHFAQVTKQQWHEDLQFLARELPKRHANAFHHTPRERFEAEVAELDRRLDRLNGDEVLVGLERLANLVGDGHTNVQFPPDRANFPLNLLRFGDEYRATHASPRHPS